MLDGATPLNMAAENGHLEVVRCLVRDGGAAVDQANQNGQTPLMIASGQGHLAIVRFLVRKGGADVNRADSRGVTAIMGAAEGGHERVIKYLTRHGANLRAESILGTAVTAAQSGAHATLSEWIQRKAHSEL
jgi:ankyrin repeat protein